MGTYCIWAEKKIRIGTASWGFGGYRSVVRVCVIPIPAGENLNEKAASTLSPYT